MDKAFMKWATPPKLKMQDLRPIFIGVELRAMILVG